MRKCASSNLRFGMKYRYIIVLNEELKENH